MRGERKVKGLQYIGNTIVSTLRSEQEREKDAGKDKEKWKGLCNVLACRERGTAL